MLSAFKGNKIRGTLFDDEIENFQNIFEHEKEYIIADAPIRNTNPMYRHKEGDYYLSFGGSTAIQSLNPNTGPILPKYTPIAEVPPTSSVDDHFGFSLASSMSTTIDPNPTGLEVNALKAWILENQECLSDHMGH
uniref:Uncharacterized protein n=1 Tax=Chenopodium quinoa TaxID=63459 RepID=A0A803MH57_CHEQI